MITVHRLGDETFQYDIPGHPPVCWNVTAAKRAVAAGQVVARVTVPPDQLAAISQKNDWTQAGVDRADPTVPGIGAPLIWDGGILYVLIDGTHRAVRALQTGVPFDADLLTDDASRACLITAPTALIP